MEDGEGDLKSEKKGDFGGKEEERSNLGLGLAIFLRHIHPIRTVTVRPLLARRTLMKFPNFLLRLLFRTPAPGVQASDEGDETDGIAEAAWGGHVYIYSLGVEMSC